MAKVACACGQTYEAPPGDAICPGCGSISEVAPEKIRIACSCGAKIAAPASLAGKRVKCPKCGVALQVPAPEPEIGFASEPEPAPEASPLPSSPRAGETRQRAPAARARSAAPPPPANDGWRAYGRWGLAFALLPLILSVFTPNDDDVRSRLRHMVERDPSLAKKLEKAETPAELFGALPDHRIEGAFHSQDTWAHWLYAMLSAAAFWGLILLLYPMGRATSKEIWLVGAFVGTVGILLLLGFQYIAAWTQGLWIKGGSVLVIFFYIVKFIGYSYRAAMDPSNGFFLSMLGFTFGVGLCEELCKSLPVLRQCRKPEALDVRGAVVWGLAAGIGFGVSEGITYSSDFYNGVHSGGVYVVRFVSCVALHAVWSAINSIFIWNRQAEIDVIDSWHDWLLPILLCLGPSMVLHGLYDTLLKRNMEVGALLTAVVSFALFFWLYDRAVREEAQLAPAAA